MCHLLYLTMKTSYAWGQAQGKFKIHIFCVLCYQLEQEHMCTFAFVDVPTQFMKKMHGMESFKIIGAQWAKLTNKYNNLKHKLLKTNNKIKDSNQQHKNSSNQN